MQAVAAAAAEKTHWHLEIFFFYGIRRRLVRIFAASTQGHRWTHPKEKQKPQCVCAYNTQHMADVYNVLDYTVSLSFA